MLGTLSTPRNRTLTIVFLMACGALAAAAAAAGISDNPPGILLAFISVAGQHGGAGALRGMLEGIGVAAFLVAVLVCPPAIFVSAVGTVAMAVRSTYRRRKPGRSTT